MSQPVPPPAVSHTEAHPLTALRDFWQGERVRLRGIEPEDGERFYAMDADSALESMLDYINPPDSLARMRAWTQKQATQEIKDDQILCVIENRSGDLVGLINAHTLDRRVGVFRYGIAIFHQHRRCGYASEAIVIFVRYFFEELRYQKVTVTVHACNPASMQLHERLGFQLEGRLRRMVYTQGQYFDELYYGMTCEEFAERYGRSVW